MKAVIAKQPGGPEVLELVDIDQPQTGAHEVKIRVKAFGLNKAESYYRSGNYGTFVPNQALGIEAVGEIVEDPSNAFRVGQKVITAMGGLMFGRHGGYAEYITAKVSNVQAINSDISYEDLAGLPESFLTVWGALDKNLEIKANDVLLVRGGTSSIGMAAIVYAKARGLTVVATTRQEENRTKLLELGADLVVIDNGAIKDEVRKHFPQGVDKALEVVGAATVKDTLQTVRHWGQVCVVGLLGGAPIIEQFNLMGDLPNTVRLSFFSSGLFGTEQLPLNQSPLNFIADQIHTKTMKNLIVKKFNVADIQEAHRLLDSNKAFGKIVVKF